MYINIRERGAAGDGQTLDSPALVRAIKEVNQAGGGTVAVPPGVYRCNPFELLSHVTLLIEPGGVILANSDPNVYPEWELSLEGVREMGLIYAIGASQITVAGGGMIDLNGRSFRMEGEWHDAPDLDRKYTRQKEAYMSETPDGPIRMKSRPGQLIQFFDCSHVTLRDIVIRDAPHWTVHFNHSSNIVVSGVSIENDQEIPNSDGIHCTSCKYVRISDCHIVAGDDAIAITGFGFRDDKAEHILISNCSLFSRSSGIRIGYGHNDIESVTIQNVTINANRGIGLYVRNEGSIRNVLFSNIHIQTRIYAGHWWGNGEPIHISAVPFKFEHGGTLGEIRGVYFSNVIAEGESGNVVYADRDAVIEDISLQQVSLRIRCGTNGEGYGGNLDLRPTMLPSQALFEHNESGLLLHNVCNVDLNQVKIVWDKNPGTYFEYGVDARNSRNIRYNACAIQGPGGAGNACCM